MLPLRLSLCSVEHDFRLQEGQVVRTWKVGDPPEGSPQTATPPPATPLHQESPKTVQPSVASKKNRKKCFWFLWAPPPKELYTVMHFLSPFFRDTANTWWWGFVGQKKTRGWKQNIKMRAGKESQRLWFICLCWSCWERLGWTTHVAVVLNASSALSDFTLVQGK